MESASSIPAASAVEPMPAAAKPWLRQVQPLRRVAEQWLASYGLVLFGMRGLPALLLVAATFLDPLRGGLGLLGLAVTRGLARTFAPALPEFDVQWLGCNGLLVGLILALLLKPSVALAGLVVLAAAVALGLGLALKPWFERYVGAPLLSLPFVLAGWLALLAAHRFAHVAPGVPLAASPHDWLPTAAVPLLRSLGAVLMVPTTAAGALVLLALLAWSRWAALLALLGYAAARLTYAALGGPDGDLELHLLGFNAILTAVALGGVFVVLSKASLVLAALTAATATLLGAALLQGLQVLELPVLAAPFVLVVAGTLLALVQRLGAGPLQLVRGSAGRPEEALDQVLQQARRYPPPGVPLLHLPVMGRWLVSQGPGGALTHQGLYAHAWDFEVQDDDGQRWRDAGTEPHHFYAFGAPVVAPADGTVVRAIGHLPDNPIGHVDTARNWGNALVIAHRGGVYSALCHLQQGSLQVREGATVVRGQLLARVGNSGRSPVPHLHLQVQASPEVGAPTIPAEFLQFIRTSQGERRYLTHASPAEGDLIEALQPDAELRTALALAPGNTWNWQFKGHATPQTWTSTIDALGQRRLVSDDASAGIYVDDSYATVLDFRGSPRSLLALFAVAAARVPFAADATVQWHDSPSALPFLSPLRRLGAELLLPLGDGGGLQTRSRTRVTPQGWVVTTEIAAAPGLPERLELHIDRQRGLVGLRGWRGGEAVVDAEVAP